MHAEIPETSKSKESANPKDGPPPYPDLLVKSRRTFSRKTQSAIKLKLSLLPSLHYL